MITNNVTRFLDSHKIKYATFELPAEKLGARETARLIGVETGMVFKTIVVLKLKPGKPILAAVPGNSEVNLKLLAVAVNEKKLQLSTQAEAEKLTGLMAGGISPLALINRGFQIWLDSAAQNYTEIHISGGQRGLNIRLPVADLIRLTGARVAAISNPDQES